MKVQPVNLQPSTEALTAAVAVLPQADLDRMPRYADSWQTRAWRLWRVLGVLYYPTSFKAKQVARLGWKVEVDGKELDEEQSAAALEAVTGPLSVREAARRIALNYEVAAEVYYVRMADEWKVYASTTPKLKTLLKGADIIVRAWQPDPEYPDRPSSAVQAALNTAEQIRLQCALSRGQDRNRLAQRGILLIPKEGQFPGDDPFLPKLEASMTAPIADEYSASAVVPPVVDYPAELIEKWRYLLLDSPYDDKLMDRIDSTIKQLAIELDMPPEMLLGNMDSNHWNAWLSSEENYQAHVEPLGASVGEVFAEAMMQAVDGAVKVKVVPDPTELLMRRPTFPDALDALKMGVVNFDFVMQRLGANPDTDKPSQDELDLILALTRGRELVQAVGVPGPSDTAPAIGPPELPAAPVKASEPPGVAPPTANGTPVTAAVGKRKAELETLARRLSDMDIRLLSVLEGLASMAVDHARATATDDVGATHVVATEMERLGTAWNREVTQARKALKHLGIDASGAAWDEAQQASAHLLTTEMTAFVTSTLERTDADMPALPVLVLRRVLAAAGGSGTATVAAITRNPAPTFSDPQGFAIGVLAVSDLKYQNVLLTQWRFRYGPLTRDVPFEPHEDADGQYMTADGQTSEGYSPGDHKGCECQLDPVFIEDLSPDEVTEALAEEG